MLQILNRSPLETGLSLFTDAHGRDVVTVAAKATFKIPSPGHKIVLAGEQVPLRHADGPAEESDGLCLYPADVVLGKPASDVGLSGSAYSPGGRAVESASVRLSVGNLVKTAAIRSDTPWTSIPVRSFLFASPADTRRRKYAGTYDAAWQAQHFPLLPKDFDLRFFNAAAPELVANGYLLGGERVTLVNLSPRGGDEFVLPTLNVWLRFREGRESVTRQADLWNVLFEPDHDRFCLSWGCAHPIGKQPSRLRDVEVRVTGDLATLQKAGASAVRSAQATP
jgi:hypothetical protein